MKLKRYIYIFIFSLIITAGVSIGISYADTLDIGLNQGKSAETLNFKLKGLNVYNDNKLLGNISNEEKNCKAKVLPKIYISDKISDINSTANTPIYIDKTGQTYKIASDGKGSLKTNVVGVYCKDKLILAIQTSGDIGITGNDNLFETNGKKYRESLKFVQNDTGLTAVNHIDMELYLYGVVPAEMPASWDIEALKAQAVAARSFAVRNKNKFIKQGYNLTDDTRSQAYGGYSAENANSNKAVDETKDIVGLYNGSVAELIYNSSSGGASISAGDLWGGEAPYLAEQKDPYVKETEKWNFTASKADLNKLAQKYKLGEFKGLTIDKTTDLGSVLDITIKCEKGDKRMHGDDIRMFFAPLGLKSLNFTINSGTGEPVSEPFFSDVNGFLASMDYAEKMDTKLTVYGESYSFSGAGNGHCVGMSQYGAKEMADSGKNYKEIIEFYYPGVKVGRI